MVRRLLCPLFLCLPVVLGDAPLRADDAPFHYPEGKHGKGELRYVNALPVLTVEGTPEEIGEQVGVLAARPARRILAYPEDLLKHYRVGFLWSSFVSAGNQLFEHFPPDAKRELEALARAAGVERDRVVVGNTIFDIKKMIACSALLVEPGRSTTGGPLFGRNLDYPSLGYAHQYSLVTVYRPQGKHAFVSVGYPGLIGCLSGMNDAGLTVAVLEVLGAKAADERFDPAGLPYALCYRRLLEDCANVAEAEKLLCSLPRTTVTNLAVCDRHGAAVFEVTPKRVVVRRAEDGLCTCTNHFRTPELRPARQTNEYKTLDRYGILEEVRSREKIGVEDLHARLHAANQRDHTLQTMVFEPAALRLHLAIGGAPASAGELKVLGLKEYLGR